MQNHPIRVFTELSAGVPSVMPQGAQKNKREKTKLSAIDEEIIIRLNTIANQHPFCRYKKAKSRDIL